MHLPVCRPAFSLPFFRMRHFAQCVTFASMALAGAGAMAAPSILIDAASGDVLEQQDATRSWFPASTTKLMTVYVALDAVSTGRMSLNTPMIVSPRALSMAPSKMGFAPGTQVTLDNALKMLMVKSANDIAVTIAEGVSGSVEAFADEMNASAAKLGCGNPGSSIQTGCPIRGMSAPLGTWQYLLALCWYASRSMRTFSISAPCGSATVSSLLITGCSADIPARTA